MTDISREAVERLADMVTHNPIAYRNETADTLRALRDKLDEAEKALEPFSVEAGWWFSRNCDADEPVVEAFSGYNGGIVCGDLFRADRVFVSIRSKPND